MVANPLSLDSEPAPNLTETSGFPQAGAVRDRLGS
jgi:hypothetical protein